MSEQSLTDWKKDSQSFDTVANLYDRFRPAYPLKLVDYIIGTSGLPQDGSILEIGSGTGKATRLFASRGYSILCIEPGENLAAVAAQNLHAFPQVAFEIARFEQSHEPAGKFDLVMAAQAFHWVSKDIGYTKAGRALKPGGAIALYWNMNPGLQGQIAADLDEIYRKFVPQLDNPLTYCEDRIQIWIDEIELSGCFGQVTVGRFPWSHTYQTGEYLGLLNTYSDHLRLSEQTRQRLFKAIAATIDAHGGSIKRDYIAVAFIANKRS